MVKNLILIAGFLGFLIPNLFGQNSPIHPDVLMLKLKAENRALISEKGIADAYFNEIVGLLTQSELTQVFPHHQLPEASEAINRDQFVDLGLWFQLKFTSEIPMHKLISFVMQSNLFEVVELRAISELLWTVNDPKQGNQYYLNRIQAFEAWEIERGSASAVVGITDTGIDKVHEDLAGALYYNSTDTLDGIDNDNDGYTDNYCGWDLGNNDNNAQWQVMGHGTFVSGFVSAVPNNSIGIAGLGYHTKVLPVRIDDSLGFLVKDYEGIVYAADHGANIINCSWGNSYGSVFGSEAVKYATYNRNALVVAACGNSNNSNWLYPASYPEVLSCAATDSLDQRWSQSSYGAMVDLSAPGTFVYSTWIGNAYSYSHGTSFSAPLVAAAAALVKSHFPTFTALQIAEQLRVSADNIDTIAANIGYENQLGSGRLNVYKALTDTLSPSVRFDKFNYFVQNDTLFIGGQFFNYLRPTTSQLFANISSSSAFLLPIEDSVAVGQLNTLAGSALQSDWFRFRILPNTPIGFYTDLNISFHDSIYTGYQKVRVMLNSQLSQLDTNNISVTFTSLGTLGFTDVSRMFGDGFSYRNSPNLISYGGLLIANSSTKVSDNIYGVNNNDQDFTPISQAIPMPATPEAHQAWLNSYNDNGANAASLKVKVD